ncbi:MAG: hypothetical protein G5Z43_001415 [Caldisphaeraceae archaeon]|nr:hypothetical protein [Caldisphaeraceae archaeon]MEB3691999.1 hypothetical protein [Caldisphaeraceae archaeon]
MGIVTPLFSCANESKATIKGLRSSLISSKVDQAMVGQAIFISVALNELLTKMRFMRKKPLHGYQSYKNNENISYAEATTSYL